MVDALRGALGQVDLALTRAPGDAMRLAAAATAERRPLVVCLGGDGTLNEVVNGLLGGGTSGAAGAAPPPAAALPRVGLLATGTGGDFGRALGIDRRFDAYLAALAAGRERLVDVGRARFATPGGTVERYWVNVLSAGIGGLVDRYAASAPAALGGRLAYGQAAIRGILACRRTRLRCRMELADGRDDERDLYAHAVAICNGRAFGGGMNIAPMARVDDGLLEVVTFETESRWRLVRRFGTVYAGTHTRQPGVSHSTCRSLRLEVSEPVAARARSSRPVFPLDVDGDALGDVPLEVDVLPRALAVRA